MKIIDRLHGFCVRSLTIIGSMLILLGSMDSRVAYSDDGIELTCFGGTGPMCLVKTCGTSETGSQCNSKSWPYQTRENYPYRTCSGMAGTCVGKNANFVSCANKFYNKKNAEGKCEDQQCVLETKITACPPEAPAP